VLSSPRFRATTRQAMTQPVAFVTRPTDRPRSRLYRFHFSHAGSHQSPSRVFGWSHVTPGIARTARPLAMRLPYPVCSFSARAGTSEYTPRATPLQPHGPQFPPRHRSPGCGLAATPILITLSVTASQESGTK
jgi:hypothetical protein